MNEWQAVQARFSWNLPFFVLPENFVPSRIRLSDVQSTVSKKVSEQASDNVGAVELAQLGLHMELVHSPEHTLKLAGAMFAGNVHTYAVNIVLSGGKITMKIRKSGNSLQNNDMGIAKYQFAFGAAECGVNGKWQWGDGGEFEVQE